MAELKEKQLEIYNHNDGDMIVSASAGSGKTFVMIARMIRLVSENFADVDSLLALTFTEAAAKEMKFKLKSALKDKIKETDDNRLKEQLRLADGADIGTIHGFCAKLIRIYFYKVGLSCDFAIADDNVTAELKSRAIDKTLSDIYEKKEARFTDFIKRYSVKRKDDELKKIIIRAYDFAETESDPEAMLLSSVKNYDQAEFEKRLDEFNLKVTSAIIKYAERLSDIEAELINLSATPAKITYAAAVKDAVSAMKGADVFSIKKFEKISAKNSGGVKNPAILALTSEITAIRDEINDYIAICVSALADSKEEEQKRNVAVAENTSAFCDTIKNFKENYERIKRDENILDFSDLEHFALKILEDEDVTKELKSKYKYIFIDEYQDVNDVQSKILSRIESGNTFMVGDLKQSIYGFRGSSPEIFQKKAEELSQKKEGYVELNYNFRSSPKVINAVNDVFSFCMTKESFGLDYKNDAKLEYGGLYEGSDNGRAELHLLKKSSVKTENKGDSPEIYDVLKNSQSLNDEIKEVAALIVKIINEERLKTWFDPSDKKEKPITYGDIAVLTRSRESAYVKNVINGISKFNVPVSATVADDVTEYKEIKSLISFLNLVAGQNDDVSLATALLSPVGKFTEEDLAVMVSEFDKSGKNFFGDGKKERRKTFFDAYVYCKNNPSSAVYGKTAAFCDYLKKVRFYSEFHSASEVLKKVVSDKNIFSYLLTERNGKIKAARVRRFIEAAGENEECTADFITRLAYSPVKLLTPADENSVKVMTMHSSKGLEYPVVIIVGTEKGINKSEDREAILFDRESGFITEYFDDEKREKYQTLLRENVRERFKKNRTKEEMRIFYVALTRAKYSLHVIFEGNKDLRKEVFNGAEKPIEFIPKQSSFTENTEHPEELEKIYFEREPKTVIFSECDENEKHKMQERFSFNYPFTEDTLLPLKSSVTAALKSENTFDSDDTEENTPIIFSEYDGAESKEHGILAHKIMELLDFERLNEFDLQIEEMTAAGELDKEALKGLDLKKIKKAATSGAFDGVGGKTLYREKRFIANVPANLVFGTKSQTPVLIQGVIDLLAVGKNDAEIIDYKYSNKSAEKLKETYYKQLDLYAYSVEKSLNVKVTQKRIVSLLSGESVIIE